MALRNKFLAVVSLFSVVFFVAGANAMVFTYEWTLKKAEGDSRCPSPISMTAKVFEGPTTLSMSELVKSQKGEKVLTPIMSFIEGTEVVDGLEQKTKVSLGASLSTVEKLTAASHQLASTDVSGIQTVSDNAAAGHVQSVKIHRSITGKELHIVVSEGTAESQAIVSSCVYRKL